MNEESVEGRVSSGQGGVTSVEWKEGSPQHPTLIRYFQVSVFRFQRVGDFSQPKPET